MGFNNGNSSFGFGGSSGSGGGGGGLTQVITTNTNTFSFYGQGTAGNPLCGCPILSACPNNALSVCPDGLYATDNNSAVILLGSGCFSSVRCGVNNTASALYSGSFGGKCNTSSGVYSFVGGGLSNTSSNCASFLGGGSCNINSGLLSFIGGGIQNITSGTLSSTLGGCCNITSGSKSATLSGYCNTIIGGNSVLSGGFCNSVNANQSFLGSGFLGVIDAPQSFIGSGISNIICTNACNSNIVGGRNNTVSNPLSSILGGQNNKINSSLASINGGAYNNLCNSICPTCALGSVIVGGVGNNTTGGTWDIATCTFTIAPTICNSGQYSFIGGGFQNRVLDNFGIVVGGCCNVSNCSLSFTGGGFCNTNSGIFGSFLGGGGLNVISSSFGNLVGGRNNIISGDYGFIGNGDSNISNGGRYSFIGAGANNTSSGYSTFIGDGRVNRASGDYTFIGNGVCNNICNNTSSCLALGGVVVGGVGNNTIGGTWSLATCCFTAAPTICNAGQYSFIGSGFQNRANGTRSSIISGQFNDTCGFSDSHIVGSCLCASQSCTTFVNCLSAANIPSGCAVCVTTNNVLVGFTTPNYNIGLYTQTANSTPISGTTIETDLINGGLGSLSVPANGFKVGDSFVAIMGGLISAANNQTIRIRVKTGSVILLDSGTQTITNITNDVFTLNLNFTIRQIGNAGVASIVSLGTFTYNKTSNSVVESFAFNSVNNTTFDTTTSNTLSITVQWGSNNAGNSIYSDIFTLNKTY